MSIQVITPPASTTISNGAIINGVANFWQSTPPSTRIGGSALVDGDIWNETGKGTWIRKGIYWIGSTPRILFAPFTNTSPTINSVINSSNSFSPPSFYYSEKLVLLMDANRSFGNNSGSIYANFNFDLINPGSGTNVNLLSLSSQGIMQFGTKTIPHENFVANSSYMRTRLIITSLVGSLNSSSLQFGFEYHYREVYR